MSTDKVMNKNNIELVSFICVYILLFIIAFVSKDNIIAVISAFCGITYTIIAGKGNPFCYIIGISGTLLYSYLAYKNSLWGNLFLYAGYYLPMQIAGFLLWKKNLKEQKNEIIKTNLQNKEAFFLFFVTGVISLITIILFFNIHDRNPIIDGITTIFSLLGMYLTVRRCIEQWIVWGFVNGLSLIMWLKIAVSGIKVYSTVFMWFVYLILAIYFYIEWCNEIKLQNHNQGNI